MFNFEEVWPSLPFIAAGALVTLKYTIISVFFGMILGTLLALGRMSSILPLSLFAKVYTSIFRGTPLLVQLTLVYYATPQLTGYKITAFEAGILAFSFVPDYTSNQILSYAYYCGPLYYMSME